MLHIIKTIAALQDARLFVSQQDAMLLIEDSVYAAISQHKDYVQGNDQYSIYVLDEDAKARGIDARISPSIHVINYAEFVELTVEHSHSMTWE